MRHKNNVQKRIKEARQKSRDQQEQTRNKSQTLREIERAALKAYEKDLAGDPTRRHDSAVRDAIQGRKVGTDIAGVTSNSSQWTAAAAAAAYFTNPQPVPMYSEGQHVVGRHAKVVSSSSSFSQTSTVEQPSTIEENSEVNIKMEKEEPAQWVRGLSPEGYTYYYNTSTGGTKSLI
jgi:WW domain-binding protein 4